MRDKFTFLRNWCVDGATCAWGNSIIFFCNVNKEDLNEFPEDLLNREKFYEYRNDKYKKIDFNTIIQPMSGGLTTGSAYMIKDFDQHHFSEFSLQYMNVLAKFISTVQTTNLGTCC